MEEHRARIEADHNKGIPPHQWESMETILRGFLEYGSPRDCARAYALNESRLRRFLGLPPRLKRMRIPLNTPRDSTIALRVRRGISYDDTGRCQPIKAKTVAKRISRGMDALAAETAPVMDKSQRATKAALTRWARGW